VLGAPGVTVVVGVGVAVCASTTPATVKKDIAIANTATIIAFVIKISPPFLS